MLARDRLGVMKDYWQRGVNDRSAGNNALPFKDGSLAAELWADGYSGRPYLRDKNGKPLPEPGPYDAAVEKGAITQDEADFLVSERERIAADEQASFFAEGMTADADKHAKHDGPFAWLRKREDA